MEKQYSVRLLTSDAKISLNQDDIRQSSAKELYDDRFYKLLSLFVYFVDQ
jgi:hypothetical protein